MVMVELGSFMAVLELILMALEMISSNINR
jgi:hypothetical protein